MMSVNRKKGRPRKNEPVLTKDLILQSASVLLRGRNEALSIRLLARNLGVDPMAIYTYFANRQSLEEELVIREFDRLYAPQEREENWLFAAKSLVMSYLSLLRECPGLLSTILRMGSRSAGPAAVFRHRFRNAVSGLNLPERQMDLVLEFVVDAVHGFALADQLSEFGAPSLDRFGTVLEFYLETLGGREPRNTWNS